MKRDRTTGSFGRGELDSPCGSSQLSRLLFCNDSENLVLGYWELRGEVVGAKEILEHILGLAPWATKEILGHLAPDGDKAQEALEELSVVHF